MNHLGMSHDGKDWRGHGMGIMTSNTFKNQLEKAQRYFLDFWIIDFNKLSQLNRVRQPSKDTITNETLKS